MEILTAFWQSCLSVIKTITVFDVIDILIVAFLIYKLIQLLRETRAEQLVKGIIILGAAYLISTQLGLKTMSFLLVNLANFGIIAIVVVFQPDLRLGKTRMMFRAGSMRLMQSVKHAYLCPNRKSGR